VLSSKLAKILAFGALASCGLAQFASADEYRPRRAAAAPAAAPTTTSWTGFQTGANAGVSSLSQNFAEPGAFLCDVAFPCVETPFHFSGSPSSFTAGGFGGYRLQLGILVIGAEADVAFKRAQTSLYQADFSTQGVSETFTGRLQQGWDASLRGRLGVLVTPALLVYGTGGGAIGNVAGSFSYQAEFPCCVSPSVIGSGSWSETRTGYTVGGGLETALLGPVKARIEYRYTDFGTISQSVPLSSFGCTASFVCGSHAHIETRAAFNTVRLGLGVDF